MSFRLGWVGPLACLVGCSILWSCGGSNPIDGSATPTAVAAATATATATPTGTPFPGEAGCNAPPVTTDANVKCTEVDNDPSLTGDFVGQVDTAIGMVIAQHPDYFNPDGGVKDQPAFRVAFVQSVEAQGLCVVVDGEEFSIKASNDKSEQYHPILSNGHFRRGVQNFRATCRPATFPVNPKPLPPDPECSILPPSRDYGCQRLESSTFYNTVNATVDQVIKDRPDLTDGQFVVAKQIDYYNEVISRLRKIDGVCAKFDGEELAIKNGNTLSEQFHLVLSNGMLHRGFDSYRGTCKPATF